MILYDAKLNALQYYDDKLNAQLFPFVVCACVLLSYTQALTRAAREVEGANCGYSLPRGEHIDQP